MDDCCRGIQENGHLLKGVAKLQFKGKRSCKHHLWWFLHADTVSDSLHVCHTQDDTDGHENAAQNEYLLQGR